MNTKRILGAVFSIGLVGRKVDVPALAQALGSTGAEVRADVRRLSEAGLLESERGKLRLTQRGRRSIRVVFIGGGFEIIHFGHVHTITKAKGLGDVLVVSVARDSTIRRRKNREPVVGEADRVKMLSALRDVDAAILGVKGDIYVTLQRVSPDIVALGYDQYHLEGEIRREAKKRGIRVKVVRLDSPNPGVKTSKLLNEL